MSAIYLALNSSEWSEQRLGLLNTLIRAGLQAFPTELEFSGDFHLFEQGIRSSGLSLHVFGNTYGSAQDDGISIEEKQYLLAIEKLRSDPSHKVLIWFPHKMDELKDQRQIQLVSGIRNSIQQGVYFSNTNSAIQLVEDIRSHLNSALKVEFNVSATDIFLIYNQLDDQEALEVVDMLSDIVPVERLNIVQDSDLDYSEFCSQQIEKSKLAVVYFKESADWALPFTQQIWKKIGGASSHTPILLIGDDDPESNVNKKFKAPKVVSLIVSGELIPLEIKVLYDKVLENAI